MKSLDTETYIFLPGLPAPKLVVGQVADERPGSERLLTPPETLAFIRHLEATAEEVAVANGPYDFGVACAEDPSMIDVVFWLYERGLVRDTHVRQPLLDLGRGTLLRAADGSPMERYSLAAISEKVLGLDLSKDAAVRLTFAHLDGVPFSLWPEDHKAYALKDARRTHDVVRRQGEGEPDAGIENLALEPAECRASWALHLMRCWGPRTDPAMVDEVVREVTQAHDAAVARFTEAGIWRGENYCRRDRGLCEQMAPHSFKMSCSSRGPWLPSKVGTKDQAWLKLLVTRAYQRQPPLTASQEVSTERDVLLESGDPLLMALGEAGRNEKEYSTYLDVIRRGTQVPISVEYDLIKRTTRTSARNPNLQNLPRGGRSRECFVARPGTVWCSVDMPSLELCTLAQNCIWMFGWSRLAEILNDKVDPHVLLASMMVGVEYDAALAAYKAKDSRMYGPNGLRQACKPVNYGMGGGMSAESLVLYARQPANGGVRFCRVLDPGAKCGSSMVVGTRGKATGRPLCEACVRGAEKFRAAWFAMLPEMRQYFERVGEETAEEDVVIDCRGPDGEPTLFIRDRNFSEAANLRFQCLAARMLKDSLWRVARASYVERGSPLFDSRPTLFVHDEIIAEMPEARASAAAEEQARLMNAAAKHWCPDVRCVAEPALMRRWFKGAELVRGKGGEILPWWPKTWNWSADQDVMRNDLSRQASKGQA